MISIGVDYSSQIPYGESDRQSEHISSGMTRKGVEEGIAIWLPFITPIQ